MSKAIPRETDVIVIGGGPAGSTASTLLAQKGYKVELFEREHFPRFHIGESLIPQTYHVLKRLDMLPKMKGSHFVKKYSVQFVNQRGKLSEPFYFVDHKPHESSQTWQVRRSEFDQHHARQRPRARRQRPRGRPRAGSALRGRQGGRRAGASRRTARSGGAGEGRRRRQRPELDDHRPPRPARVGPGAEEGGPLDLLEGGVPRHRPGRGGDARHPDRGQDRAGSGTSRCTTTSSASASSPGYDYLFKDRPTKDLETIYFEEVAQRPGPAAADRERRRAATSSGPRRSTRTGPTQAAGDGWVLVGDAFGFLDPLYSSGVLLALTSGSMAADAIDEGLAKGDTSAKQLRKWEPDFVHGMERMRRLVCEFYDGFSFGRFVKQAPAPEGTWSPTC